uniref:GBF1-like tetratricopeptide repeats domain-containing protein n=1 Tax=Caenorhabditis japonica TaxID=281687 RepID=A0A8R1E4Q5_CAEJA
MLLEGLRDISQRDLSKLEISQARSDGGLLSWFGLGGGQSEAERRKPSQEQLSAMKLASQVISECRPSQIVADSKYLTSTSLAEMLSSIAANSAAIVEQVEAQQQKTFNLSGEDEDALVFYLELIVAITLENKDRLPLVWPHVRQHIEWLYSPRFGRCQVLVERAVVGLLRVANRNLFRDNTVSDDVLNALSMLLKLPAKALFVYSRQIAFGLYELIRANAANVHKKEHWAVLFNLLEAAGAAVLPYDYVQKQLQVKGDRNAYSDVENSGRSGYEERGYTSEGDETRRGNYDSASDLDAHSRVNSSGSLLQKNPDDFIHLDHKDAAKATEEALRALGATSHKNNFNRFGSLVLRTGLGRHEPAAFFKVCECLAFLLRDAVHITPDNFDSSLQCLRTMVEASLDGGVYAAGPLGDTQNRLRSTVTEERAKKSSRHHHHQHGKKKDQSDEIAEEAEKSRNEEKQMEAGYQQMSLHLLDLCSQLHSQTPPIFAKWAQGGAPVDLTSVSFVWTDIWRPLLQAMGRLSCDRRQGVRAAALTHLQRAFLPANMATLGAAEWQSCFGEVLFPLLTKLLEPVPNTDSSLMEDTRVRTLQIVAKTLLNHLSALSALNSFPDLWLRLLDYMEQYLNVDSCGNLKEAVPESLKNMLLVMDSTGIFVGIPGLYEMTVERLNRVLPQLIKDTIPNPPSRDQPQVAPQAATSSVSQEQELELATVSKSSESVDPSAQSESTTSFASNPATTECSTAPIPIAQPTVPLTEVIVHSGPTSPVRSPPHASSEAPEASSSSPSVLPQQQEPQQQPHEHQQYQQYQQQQQHYQQQQQQYQNYQQQQQYQHYQYSPEAAAYYQQQYAQQQQQYAEQYAQYQQYHQQQAQQQQQQVQNPSVHGQYSVANPLSVPTHPYHPIVAPSANSAFSQVYSSTNPHAQNVNHHNKLQDIMKDIRFIKAITNTPIPPPLPLTGLDHLKANRAARKYI